MTRTTKQDLLKQVKFLTERAEVAENAADERGKTIAALEKEIAEAHNALDPHQISRTRTERGDYGRETKHERKLPDRLAQYLDMAERAVRAARDRELDCRRALVIARDAAHSLSTFVAAGHREFRDVEQHDNNPNRFGMPWEMPR